MPWENNSNDGGRPGGPWGQIPGGGGNGPRRPSNSGPNIEDLFKRGREQFGGGLPGGRMLVIGAVVVLAFFWLYNSVYQIEANQVGVVTFLGQPQEQTSEQGLHFMLWPLARVQTVKTTQNQIDIGTSTNARASDRRPDADRRPEHRQCQLLGILAGVERPVGAVQRPRTRGHGAPRCRKRHARGRRTPASPGCFPRQS